MDSIVVVGGGGHAKVLISVLKKLSFSIVGYTDRQGRGTILGAEYLGDDNRLKELIEQYPGCNACVGIGKIDASAARMALQRKVELLGFEFPPIISPNAIVNEHVRLGSGTTVFDGAVINSGTVIGDTCIVNTNSTVEHDCSLGNNVHIAPGVTLSGGVTIGDNAMLGTGVNVIQGVTICGNCVIGAGSTVVRDITAPGTYVGTPPRRLEQDATH
jgi:sugar O-acyltransferase (sialic acid O-acetyltransferase NeuD family)